MKISPHFISEEFLPSGMHSDLVAKGINPQWFIRKQVVDFCEWLADYYHPRSVIINNWKWNGGANESGLRAPNSTTGAYYSQHKFKDAIDIKIKGVTPSEIRKVIIDNFTYLNTTFGLSTIEQVDDTPTWIHCDFRWTGMDTLLEVNGK
jgi:hypothetical protein